MCLPGVMLFSETSEKCIWFVSLSERAVTGTADVNLNCSLVCTACGVCGVRHGCAPVCIGLLIIGPKREVVCVFSNRHVSFRHHK